MKNFTELVAWQEGHRLALEIYSMTKDFPKEELYGLVSQMRRAAVSVTSNIAEGFGRQSSKEKAQFYNLAAGSLTELQNQIYLARDLHFLNQSRFDDLISQSVLTHKIVNGLMKHTRSDF